MRWLFGFFCFFSVCAAAQPIEYDLIVRGARILDGSGNPWRYADVAVKDDRIAAVGRLKDASAKTTIDAGGLYLTPGFIDVHSHAAPALATPQLSHAIPLLAQGITTIIANPDGGGPTDLALQRRRLERDGLGVNVALLAPHGSIRRQVLEMEDRPPSADELERMKALVRTAMGQGAFGLSSGLYYAPGSYADTSEIIALAQVAAEFGGVYSSHIRDESNYNVGVVAAVNEVIEISRRAGLPGIVTHVKALGPPVWGFSQAIISQIERARREGLEVYADQYPYQASATSLRGALIPRWALAGGDGQMMKRLHDPASSERLRQEILDNLERRGGPSKLQFRFHRADRSIEGLTLQEVARRRGRTPLEMILQLLEQGNAGVVSFNMDAEDVERLMARTWVMTSSDGGFVPMGQGVPHPRNYGTFPRKIRLYVREKGVLGLPAAIRSMTSLPAAVFSMPDRGVIREGAFADLVAFDLERLRDRADYRNPHQLSEGVVWVVVNGVPTWGAEKPTGRRAGRVLSLKRR